MRPVVVLRISLVAKAMPTPVPEAEMATEPVMPIIRDLSEAVTMMLPPATTWETVVPELRISARISLRIKLMASDPATAVELVEPDPPTAMPTNKAGASAITLTPPNELLMVEPSI